VLYDYKEKKGATEDTAATLSCIRVASLKKQTSNRFTKGLIQRGKESID